MYSTPPIPRDAMVSAVFFLFLEVLINARPDGVILRTFFLRLCAFRRPFAPSPRLPALFFFNPPGSYPVYFTASTGEIEAAIFAGLRIERRTVTRSAAVTTAEMASTLIQLHPSGRMK